MNNEILPYEFSYDGGKHWRPTTRDQIRRTLALYYTEPDEVLRQIDTGDVVGYKSLRVKRTGMQHD